MTQERSDITQFQAPGDVVAAYLQAGDEGGHRRIRAAFHPAARLQWVDEAQYNAPRALHQAEWWTRFEQSAEPALERQWRELDREGGLALFAASSRWSTHRFEDLLLLAQTPAGWRIVGKVFARLASHAAAPAAAGDDAAIEHVLHAKIRAHEAYDYRLLLQTHLPDCDYFRVNVDGQRFAHLSLSQAAARYAELEDQGVRDTESPWRVLAILAQAHIAAAKLEVIWQGRRCIDYLLLLKTGAGWRIASVVWGVP